MMMRNEMKLNTDKYRHVNKGTIILTVNCSQLSPIIPDYVFHLLFLFTH